LVVRRKFYDPQTAHKSPGAVDAMERIAGLYAIESEIRGRPPSERHDIRSLRRPWLELHAGEFVDEAGGVSFKFP
jgi:transposase